MDSQHALPPHSESCEQAVLGCVLLDPSLADKLLTEIGGDESAFYDIRHQVIVGAIKDMAASSKNIDIITLQTHLKDRKNLEMCGGRGYLSELPDKTAAPAMFGTYMEVVLDKWRRRRALKALSECIADLYESADPSEVLMDRVESKVIQSSKVGSTSKSDWHDGSALARDAIDYFQKVFEARSTGGILGLPTGFIDLDKATLGLRAPELTILAALPSTGKTALAMNIAHTVAESGVGVGVFSLETNQNLLGVRTLSSMAKVSSRDFSSDQDFIKLSTSAGKLAKSPLYVNDSAYSIDEIRRAARRLHSEKRIGLIIIDYLQLIEGESKKQRHDEVGQCSRGIKKMAMELNIPVIALAQVNRELGSAKEKNRLPRMSDLRESGSIEQDADNIIFIHRRRRDEDVQDDSGSEPYPVSLIIAKQKMGPRDIEVELVFHPKHTRFTSCSRQQI